MTTNEKAAADSKPAILRLARLGDFLVLPAVACEELGLKKIPAGEYPRWAVRCGKRVGRALFPKLDPKAQFVEQPHHYQMGFGIGLIEAAGRMLTPVEDQLAALKNTAQPNEEEARKLLTRLFGEEVATEMLDEDFDQTVEKAEHEMTQSEAASYARGSADAQEMMAGKNRRNDATEIYLIMLMFWRLVDAIPTLEQFHEFLTKAVGPNRTGDLKRIAQLCQRVGKRFRAPGRPPKQLHVKRRLR